jgi:hypothetical protein
MNSRDEARAALADWDVQRHLYPKTAGDRLEAALRALLDEPVPADEREALGDQILEYLDMNWSMALDDVDRHVLAAGLSEHIEAAEAVR